MHRMNSSRRLLTAVSTLTVVWAWSSPAWSLGLGRPESQAVLGDTLRVVVPLRLEVGETVTQECVSAEVFFGDDKVPSGAVSVELQPAETVTAGMGARLLLRTTALINEAYLRLVDQNKPNWQSRSHFFGVAARLMRQILVDHARRRQAG